MLHTVSFHNFKSQNFKLSVSNPKNKYVADLSVLSRVSNCQSLGRKNKHEILKTDHMSRASNNHDNSAQHHNHTHDNNNNNSNDNMVSFHVCFCGYMFEN